MPVDSVGLFVVIRRVADDRIYYNVFVINIPVVLFLTAKVKLEIFVERIGDHPVGYGFSGDQILTDGCLEYSYDVIFYRLWEIKF